MTFNIHGCVGRGGREDPEATLDVIRQADADVVALQEVQEYDAADVTFLQGLRTLDYPHVIYGETFRKHLGPYGNVLMSRFPFLEKEELDISVETVEPRGAIRVLLETSLGRVRVTATHLGLRGRERRRQVDYLLDGNRRPQARLDVLLGDLNEWYPASRNLERMARAYSHMSDLRTFPARLPMLALDRILLRGELDSVTFGRVDTTAGRTASDHRALWAEMG